MHLSNARRFTVVLLLLAGLLATPRGPAWAQQARSSAKPPNIVLILSDDEDLGIHRYMPKVKELIEDQGTVFDEFFVPYPLCCPSRASILRGQYPHNTLILGNWVPEGGFLTFRRLQREQSTIATWLQDAGYRTGLYGKYLNGYSETDAPPPGWNEWHAGNEEAYDNVNYKLNSNGKVEVHGDAPDDYLTDLIARRAADHIRRFSAEDWPFFLFIAPFSPHSPYNPATRHRNLFNDTDLPRPPSFNEEDVSDKPSFIQELARLRNDEIDEIRAHYRRRLQCLQSVDELVETLVRTLDETGELDSTYIVYTSDNLHRLMEGKDTAYEEDIRVPFALRGPGIPAGRRIAATSVTIDLAPTFADWAGAKAPDFVDGRSLVPLLKGATGRWRNSFLIQRQGLESDERLQPANAFAIRTSRHTYIAYNTTEREMYDRVKDPYQLHNIAPTADKTLVDTLVTRLTELRACRGSECRDLEDMPVD